MCSVQLMALKSTPNEHNEESELGKRYKELTLPTIKVAEAHNIMLEGNLICISLESHSADSKTLSYCNYEALLIACSLKKNSYECCMRDSGYAGLLRSSVMLLMLENKQ